MILSRIIILLGLILGLSSCENYFGEKTDLNFIDQPDYQARSVSYVPIQPILNGFVYPTDVLAGFDELIYVVDQGTEEIISLDQSLNELARFKVQGVTKIIQNRGLEILALGTADTTDALGQITTLACIYRISLNNGTYSLNEAKITNKIIHPFYFRNTVKSSDVDVIFNDIAILANDDFYVTRNGLGSDIIAPDQSILLFSHNDKEFTPVFISSGGILYRDFFKIPFGITSLAQPPQISANTSRSFISTSLDEDAVLKINYITYTESDFGASYGPEQTVVNDNSQAEDFLQRPFRFKEPKGITISGDGTNFVFVVDAETDSLYQFTLTGLEGIKPPPGSVETKYIKASFGGSGNSAVQFNEPQAVAYLNQIVYVADAGNGRILRFKLTLDFD